MPTVNRAAPLTEADVRKALRNVRYAVNTKRYVVGALVVTGFGFTSFIVTLLHSMNPASVIRLAGVHTGSLATLGLGYWLISTSEVHTGTLAEPYLQSAEGMQAFLQLTEAQQMILMRSDRRLIDSVLALNTRVAELEMEERVVQSASAGY